LNEAARVCALLLRRGHVKSSELPTLPLFRREVDELLRPVGLRLRTSVFSDWVGLEFLPEIAALDEFSTATNLDLGRDALAMITVLWARLVLPKRSRMDDSTTPGQRTFDPDQDRESARQYQPELSEAGIVEEFRDVFGGVGLVRGLITKLANQGFVSRGPSGSLVAGPLLELHLDGEEMAAFIQGPVFREATAAHGAASKGTASSRAHKIVFEALRAAAGPTTMSDLETRTGMKPTQLRKLLRDLEGVGSVSRTGMRKRTRYSLTGGE
jgi:predicted transcriptional regulator